MLQAYVSSISDVSSGMLHAFHLDVAKVDRNVAHVAMAIHVCCECICSKCFSCFSETCCKCMFQMFQLFQNMLQVFYLNVAYVAVATHICCKRMFQILHLF